MTTEPRECHCCFALHDRNASYCSACAEDDCNGECVPVREPSPALRTLLDLGSGSFMGPRNQHTDAFGAYDRFSDLHGESRPEWDYERLREFLSEHHPRWTFMQGVQLDNALGDAVQASWDEAQAAFDKRADQRRDAEDAEYEMTRTLHDEQMQKYGAAPAPEED